MIDCNYRSGHGAAYNVEQKLQSYLRDNCSVDTATDEMVSVLIQVAKDYDLQDKVSRSDGEYNRLATEALETFRSNWQDKQPGEDNRSQRLGKTVVNTLSDLR